MNLKNHHKKKKYSHGINQFRFNLIMKKNSNDSILTVRVLLHPSNLLRTEASVGKKKKSLHDFVPSLIPYTLPAYST
jgi:hypothetical protein